MPAPRDDEGSAGMSESVGGSVASSNASSKATTTQGAVGTVFFTATVPLIPLLQCLERQYPARLSKLGIFVDTAQIFAFAINPHVAYGSTLHGMSNFFYTFHLPLWDSANANIGYYPSLALGAVLAGIMLTLFAVCVLVLVRGSSGQKLQAACVFSLVQGLLHACATWLAIPVASTFMALTVCGRGRFWAFDESCDATNSFHVLHRVLASVLFAAFAFVCYTFYSLMYDSDCFSKHPLARSHSRVDKFITAWKFTTVVLFHAANANDKNRWFNLYFAVSCILLTAVHSAILPYFKHGVNKFKSGVFMAAAWMGFVAFLSDLGGVFTAMELDFTLLACGVLPAYLFGAMTAETRIYSEYLLWKIYYLTGSVKRTPSIEPRGVAPAHLHETYEPSKELELQATALDIFDAPEMHDDDEERGTSGFLVPYTGSIWFSTDLELAARSCLYYTFWTNKRANSCMLEHAASLFTKSLVEFKDDDTMRMQLAYFSCWQLKGTKTRNFCLHMHLERCLGTMETCLAVRYQAAKLKTEIKARIGMKDNTHIKIWRSAQKLHREVLNQMANFWGKLLSSQVDTVQLAVITNAITQRRQYADIEFRKVLDMSKDDKVLHSYALFLEQVMHDEEGATEMREMATQSIEYRQRKSDTGNDGNPLHQEQLNKLKYTLVGMAIVLLFYLSGQCLYEMWKMEERNHVIQGMLETGKARMLTQQGAYRAMKMCAQQETCASFVFKGDPTPIGVYDQKDPALQDELMNLKRIASDLHNLHEKLTVGPRKTTYAPLVAYYKQPTTRVKNFFAADEIGSDHELHDVGLWNFGYEVPTVLRSFSGNGSSVHHLNLYKWIGENAVDVGMEMYSYSLELLLDKAKEVYSTHMIVTTMLYGVGLLVLITVYILMVTNVEEIEQAKLEALNLFTLIPKAELAKLQRGTKSMLTLLDQKSDQFHVDCEQQEVIESTAIESHSDEESEKEEAAAHVAEQIHIDPSEFVCEEDSFVEVDRTSAVVFLLTVVATLSFVAVSTVLLTAVNEAYKPLKTDRKAQALAYDFRRRAEDLTKKAILYTLTDSPTHLSSWRQTYGNLNFHQNKMNMLKTGVGDKPLRLYHSILTITEKTLKSQAIAMRITTSRFGAQATHLTDVTWKVSASLKQELATYQHILNNTESDLAQKPSVMALLSSKLIFTLDADSSHLEELYRSFFDLLDEEKEEAISRTAVPLLLVVGTCLSAMCVLMGLFVLVSVKRTPVLTSKRELIFMTFAFIGLSIFAFVETAQLATKIAKLADLTDDHLQGLKLDYEAFDVTRVMLRSTLAYVSTGHIPHAEMYFEVVRMQGATKNVLNVGSATKAEEENMMRGLSGIHRLCMIAMTLKAWSTGMDAVDIMRGKLYHIAGLRWDFGNEPGHDLFVSEYPGYLWYESTSADSALQPSRQDSIARSILASDHFAKIKDTADTAAHELVQRFINGLQPLDEASDEIDTVLHQQLMAAFAMLFVLLVYVLMLFQNFLERNRQFSNSFGGDMVAGDNQTLRGQICLGILAALLTGMYALQVTSLQSFRDDTETLFYTSSREAGIANAMAVGTQMVATHGTRQSRDRNRLQARLESTEVFTTKLYFGSDRRSGSLNKLTKPEELFGTQSAFQLPSCTADTAVAQAADLLSEGVDIAARYWMHTAHLLVGANTEARRQSLLGALQSSADLVVYALEQSTEHYHDASKVHGEDYFKYVLFILVATVAVLFLDLLLVFRPIISQLLQQDMGTKVMLKMIPEDVREVVPIIQEYLDSGQVRDSDPMEVINESINEMSSVPIIAIDHLGTVIRFTQGGEAVFGWQQSEIVGSNVKVLMPPEYARHHSKWLASYMRTGKRKIIGTVRQVSGYRKDHTRFPMEVAVREHRRPGEDPVFISTVQDLTKTFELEAARKLNAAMQQMSSVPLLCIDTLASITVYNKAAEMCFGFTEEEALGQNVNILMPEEHAKHHDGYLAAYIKTGVKKVIDLERNAAAVRKNGQLFPVVLSIKEVKLRDFGSSSLFLGFVRDRSADLIVEYQHLVHSIISNLNPLPIVSINEIGTILSFSNKASDLWGYTEAEILGQNVKTLMTEEVAVNHDGYLSSYLQTGRRAVLDTVRDVVAKHKHGTDIPISIEAKEVSIDTGERVYMAFIRDLRLENTIKLHQEVQSCMTEYSLMPIIKITEAGIVTVYNQAAVSVFKHSKQELIGHNVKKLTPPAVALKHDGYLEAYKRTGVRTVIGKRITTTAKKSDGSTFLIRLKVDEINSELTGTKSFLGYLQDIEEETVLEWINLLNTQINNECICPIITIDQVGKVLSFGRAAALAWGYDAAEVVGNNIKMLMPDDIAAVHDMYLSKYLRSGIKTVIDSSLVVHAKRKDGTDLPINLTVKDVVQKGGQHVYVGYGQDLTEQDRIENERSLAQTVYDASPEPIIKIDPFGTVKEVNAATCALTKYSAEDLLGSNIKILMVEKIAARHDDILASYRKTGIRTAIGSTFRNTIVRKDKTELKVELKVEEITLDDMESLYIGFMRDITDLVAREEENKVSESLASLCVVAQVAIDMKGSILRCNKSSEVTFGYSAKEMIAENVNMLMEDSIAEQHDGFLRQYRKLGIKKVIDQKTISKGKRKNGEIFDLELHIKEIVSGGSSLFLGYLRDCTEEQKSMTDMMVGESIIKRTAEAVVIIDPFGTVSVFNSAAQSLSLFATEEVVGQNVKMLMPPEVAAKHDGYLEMYRKTRVAKVLGTKRQVVLRRKDGVLVKIELSARTVGKHQKEVYVGYVRPLAKRLEFEAKRKLLETTLTLSQTPCVSINDKGMIEMWKGAYSTFGYTEEEMLGQNIKILQLPEVAVQHDGYLLRYKQTGVRTVVGNISRVKAVTKSGSVIPLDIHVREARFGDECLFVANLMDASGTFADEVATQVANAVREMSECPIITINEEGIVTMWNKAAHTVFQHTPEEAIGQNIKFITSDGVREHHDGYLQRYKRTKVKHVINTSIEQVAQRKDGTRVPCRLYLGEVAHDGSSSYVGFITDLTRQKKQKQHSLLIDEVIEKSPLSFVSINDVGIIQMVNPALCKVTGYTHNELIGKNIKLLMPEEIAVNHNAHLESYKKTGIKHVVDTTFLVPALTKAGDSLLLQLNIKELKQDSGSLFMGYVKDVTSQVDVLNQQKLSGEVRRLTSCCIIALTVSGIVKSVNQAVTDLFCHEAHEIEGKNVKMLMPQDIADQHDGFLRRYLADGVKRVVDKVRVVPAMKKDGTVFLVQLKVYETISDHHHLFLAYIEDFGYLAQLKLTSALAKNIPAMSTTPLIAISDQGTIVAFNPAAEAKFGFTHSHVLDKNVRILMPDEVSEKHDGYLHRFVESGCDTENRELFTKGKVITAESKSGELFTARLRVVHLKKHDGSHVFVGALQDE